MAKTKAFSHVDEITKQWRRERPDIDLDRFLLAIYMQRLGRIIEQDFERLCQTRYKMGASDVRVLLALRRRGPPFARRPTDLFRALLITSGAITKQVDRLVDRKLVVRRPDPDYRKGFLVQLTAKGLRFVDAVAEKIADGSAIAPAMSALSPSEIRSAARFYYRVLTLLEHAPSAVHGGRRRAADTRSVGRRRLTAVPAT